MKKVHDPDVLNEWRDLTGDVKRGLITLEPEVPFEAVSPDDFRDDGDFDFIVLSRSPGFTPPESDFLVPVISRYIDRDGAS